MSKFQRMSRDQRGFNLIELMIVIAIIGLLIGVGSLAWQTVIKSGNENAAAQSISNIRTLQAQYASKNKGQFATFDQLREKLQLDERFAGEAPVVNGYIFTMTLTPPSSSAAGKYEVWADPQSSGVTGTGDRHFYTSSMLSSIRGNDSEKAKESDPSI
jgi:prepilin-type N-terminal cleavage/methylation domain-containing protein